MDTIHHAQLTEMQWRGTEEEQRVAKTAFGLLVARARFFPENAPIRQRLDDLTKYFASQGIRERIDHDLDGSEIAALVESALMANSHVFVREESEQGSGERTQSADQSAEASTPRGGTPRGAVIVYATTKAGVPPARVEQDNNHSLRHRLFQDSRTPTEEDLKSVRGISREIPEFIMTATENETAASSAERIQPAGNQWRESVIPSVEGIQYPPAEGIHPVPESVRTHEERPQDLVESGERIHGQSVRTHDEVSRAASKVRVGSKEGTDHVIDLSQDPELITVEYGNVFRELLGNYLAEDFRFVQFGDEYYLEDKLERLSKGQLRDIKEYITERNEPLTDEELISDALRRPLQNADYNLWRFTINYRLGREKKDFRFVGTKDDRLWATTTLPPIGQSPRKPADIAQDYRYLVDPELSDDDPVAPASGADVSGRLELRHVLTWYESENGVLPVGRGTQMLMPNPLLEEQTVVVLRIQDPQNYATYMAELRLGTGNRGTYIAGLEELFGSSLVPGATFSLVQGASSNEFTIEYARQPAQEARLLQWDPRKERWFFGPVVYECPVNPAYLLTEDGYGELNGKKRATEAERKRLDALIGSAFELVGERDSSRTDSSRSDGAVITALIDDLLPAANLERPMSRAYLESVIESPQYPQFALEDPSIGLASYKK